MPATNKTAISWSSGKDSVWTLHSLNQIGTDVAGLLTTVTGEEPVTTSHRIPYPLVREQAAMVGLPLRTVSLPDPCPNETYEEQMARATNAMATNGITHLAYGDLHLEDIRAYRESVMSDWEVDPLFPLWGTNTHELASNMVDAGVEATIVCVDPNQLDPAFCGRRWTPSSLPVDIDPLGENGEFHTFCHFGPGFDHEITATVEDTYEDNGLVWARLV
ncbi:MAG: ATP-binding protein [Acidimicrobiia bacterium]|nr:ATP-binding protein [Acidimicrobiia bacterium]